MIVVFRKWKDGQIIALFPEELDNAQKYTIESYMHLGQHGGADYEGVIQQTTPASESEYSHLLIELHSIGYKDLYIRKKCRPDYNKLINDYESKRSTETHS